VFGRLIVELSFVPSPDVVVILNALLDKLENRAKRDHLVSESEGTYRAAHSIKISLTDLPLPSYFSQTDPEPRIIANQQLQTLEQQGLLQLKWMPGETNHLLHSTTLQTERVDVAIPRVAGPRRRKYTAIQVSNGTRNEQHESLYQLLNREPLSNRRAHLESLLLAEKFRYPKEDWRAHALNSILGQLGTGKSPSPFSLSDSNLNLDLLAILQTLPTLTTETPYRVFSVRLFNDTKRFDDLKPALLRLARRAQREWKSFNNEDLLREFNLVANPGYVHLAGTWELTDSNGQIIHLDSFTPSVGFSASQITSLRKITVRAESVLCIENLTSFHQQVDRYAGKHVNNSGTHSTKHATLCLMGNPSPAIRCLLRLIPEEIPIHLWSDMDYGGFNILFQLRRQISPRIQPYLMDIATFDKHAHLSRPLRQNDIHNLRRLALHPALADVHSTIHHLLKRGLKLEQEAIQI
jgi:hypothetical protein